MATVTCTQGDGILLMRSQVILCKGYVVMSKAYSLSAVANLMGVSYNRIKKCTDDGTLKYFCEPGSTHRKVLESEYERFKAEADLPAEVKVKPYPAHPPISAYFRFLLVLGALDTDQDNVISAAEIDNAPGALRTLDKNHDGVLTAEEFAARRAGKQDAADAQQKPAALRGKRFAAMDTNGDGRVTADEFAAAFNKRLFALDADGDGRITLEELKSARSPI